MTSGEQPAEGRHRHGSGTWTPQVRFEHPPAHARPEPVRLVSPPSPAETTVPGLRKFDLGTIPAPVTPPRSWRTAAWFAVGASVAVIAGLVFAAASLVGRPKNTETIDALPGYPSLPIFLDATPEQVSTVPSRPASSTKPERPTVSPSPSSRRVVSSSRVTGVAPPPVTSTEPLGPPVRQTTPKRAFATNDAKQIGDRTEAFYKQVTANPAAAYQMTTGEMRLQGEEAFKQRYSDIKSVEVRRINIDPNQGTTVSEVRITKKDGSTTVERRRLKFTSGSDPKISSEVTH